MIDEEFRKQLESAKSQNPLTVIATITMPLTVVSSIYGMNFRYMPELEWRYGYAYVWGLMIFSVIIMMWYFKRREWV